MNKCKRRNCNREAAVNPYKGVIPQYCSKKCKNIEMVTVLRKRRKKQFVDLLGGRCSKCGYDKCLSALEFHHTDEDAKSFGINRGMTMTLEKIKEELDKCILLCSNCHAEHHWPDE